MSFLLDHDPPLTPPSLPQTVLGIDPGVTGAIAFYFPGLYGRVAVYDMPTMAGEVNAHALDGLIRDHAPTVAVIERVGPMPRDGVMQAWRFSAAYNTARTVVMLRDIPLTLITPAVWKKGMGVKGGPAGKEQCRRKAIEMFPAVAGHFLRKKDQGRAEAALLAYYYVGKTFGVIE